MKNIYSTYTTDDLWLIKETEFVRELQSVRESQFTLGNGYMGTRGIYEDIPYDCQPGTFLAGVYDKMAAQVSELVNLPNPVNFKFTIGGEKLGLISMDILEHKRALNMKKGLLLRQALYQNSKGHRYDYQSLRFISQHNKNIGVMRIALTARDKGCEIDINTGMDTSVSNAGVLSEGRKKHFRVKELGQQHNAGYLVTETCEKKHTIIYWAGFYYEISGKKIISKDNIFRLKLKKGETVIFTKVFCIKHFPRQSSHTLQKENAFKVFRAAFHANFSTLLKNHISAWERLWKKADIIIAGTANIQQNLRFNIYHMLICAHCDKGFSSIGARTLSGEGYRGHIFWDAEIFLFPFYLFTFPLVAKNMLIYRYKRLEASRNIAKQNGYKGTQFAWESAGNGEEETPEWARDIDRTIVKIHTHEMEHHLTADIIYAVYKYYTVTGDKKFMEDYGYEMMIESARFWVSRVELNKRSKKYEINNVIGPDEFHTHVNNNAFTNMMAKWNLLTAAKMTAEAKKKPLVYEKLKNKLRLKDKEIKQWGQVAPNIVFKIDKNKVIEQFDGYFKLEKVILDQADENGIPLIPAKLRAKDLGKTQLIKQPDVSMLLFLLNDVFSKATKIANHKFYFPRTMHRSSLSPAVCAIAACSAGDLHQAYSFFNVALRTDISNLFGNTPEGIHAASLGGTWQALIFGLAGTRIRKEKLFVNPRLPRSWHKVIFNLTVKENVIELELTNDLIKIKVLSLKNKHIKVGIFDKLIEIKTNKVFSFKRRVGERREEEYY
ncbi:MAG: glycosyl hydrolase family 65 protein [Candidatus Omnitrophota bacterium]